MQKRWGPSRWSHVACVAIAATSSACDRVSEPTRPGTIVFEWDRAAASAFAQGKHPSQYPPHPMASAKVVDGPVRTRYRVVSQPLVGESVAFEVEIVAANVAFVEKGIHGQHWAPIHLKTTLLENDSYRVSGGCEPAVGHVKPAGGEPSDLTVECHVIAQRPTQWGEDDGLTATARMVVEGKGRLVTNQIDVASVEAMAP